MLGLTKCLGNHYFALNRYRYYALASLIVIGHSLAWPRPYPRCSWSVCSTNSGSTNTIVCGAETQEMRFKQGCHTSDSVSGFRYLCCLSRESMQATGGCSGSSNNTIWWPTEAGTWTVAYFNCSKPIEPYLNNSFVRFFLYTKNNNNPLDYKEIKIGDIHSLRNSGFITNAPLKIIFHGFLFNAPKGPAKELRKWYLRRNPRVNILAVDWYPISAASDKIMPCYNIAAELTQFVGIRSALALKFILEQNVVDLKDIHVLGHSLGAHAAGFMAKRFTEYTKKKILRLTGFDPAGPAFLNKGPKLRIDRSDANFVDVIHTGISDLDFCALFGRDFSFGLGKAVGHVDFYPNKGGRQPGCGLNLLVQVPDPLCSHFRSYEFYAESIQPPSDTVFRGKQCTDLKAAKEGRCNGPETNLMGACTNLNIGSPNSSIIYYLETNKHPPYAVDKRLPMDYLTCPIP